MTMRMMPPPAYESRDLWLAAALLASGRHLLNLSWREGRAYFIFADGAACARAADRYWSRELRVAAKDFTDALRTLKDRLHSGTPGGRAR